MAIITPINTITPTSRQDTAQSLRPSNCHAASSKIGAATVTRTKPMWTTTLVAGAAGAILTLAVLGAVGALGHSSGNDPKRNAVSTSVPIVTAQALLIVAAAIVFSGLLFLFFELTLMGKALRATAINRTGARLMGIRPGGSPPGLRAC